MHSFPYGIKCASRPFGSNPQALKSSKHRTKLSCVQSFSFGTRVNALIAMRMQARPNHFMPLSLLDSQFRDLEPLAPDERGIRLDIRTAPDQLVDQVVRKCTSSRIEP